MKQRNGSLKALDLNSLASSLREGHITGFLDKAYNKWTIVDIVRQQALLSGDGKALIAHDGTLTYSELLYQANAWVELLATAGVKRGDRVGICLERNVRLMPALFGILMCGAAYVPADPYFPVKRIKLILSDAAASVVIAERSTLHVIEGNSGIKHVLLADELPTNTKTPNVPDIATQSPRDTDVAYIMFTSGSTGRPKGVPITHRAMTNFLLSMAVSPGASSTDKVLALTTLSFDMSVLEPFLPLLVGGAIVLANREDALDPFRLAELIEQHRVSIIQATPTTWRMLLESGWKPQKYQKILCGGEAFPNDLVDVLYENSAQLWNMYGPTEATVWSSCHRISKNDAEQLTAALGAMPIGKTLANVRYLIINKAGLISKPGEPGELWIGGECLSPGYLERPELTKKQFIYSDLDGSTRRFYRTGDLVKQNINGKIYYLERIDSQVKIRGFRIELGEIESVLKKHASIKDVVIAAHTPKSGDGYLIGCLRVNENRVSFDELVRYAARYLPQYMIPSKWIVVDEFPLTPSQKVDRKKLSEQALLKGGDAETPNFEPGTQNKNIENLDDAFLSESTAVDKCHHEEKGSEADVDLEAKLVLIWQDVLGIENIGLDDNFFHIGGHSLKALRVFTRLQKDLQIKAPLSLLVQSPTIKKLANSLQAYQHDESSSAGSMVPKTVGWQHLVPFNSTGAKTPLICIHAVGGNILSYRDMLDMNSIDRPVYGIQAKGLNGIDLPIPTIEKMAKVYVEELCKKVASNQFILIGGSMGGTIAIEMANQLEKKGKKVECVVMLDTLGAKASGKVDNKAAKISLTRIYSSFTARAKYYFLVLLENTSRLLEKPLQQEMAIFSVERTNKKAMNNYKEPKYTGRVLLLRQPIEESGIYSQPWLGWENSLTGEVEVEYIDAPHAQFMESPETSRILSDFFSKN